jgi:hypothetical protein
LTTSRIRATLAAMSEATPAELDRMILSRVTLTGLEHAGMSGRPEDNRRMLREEIAVLEGFIAKYPTKAETLGAVIERYRAILRMIEN